jgi:membrane protein DedA with SNARE-associated domain
MAFLVSTLIEFLTVHPHAAYLAVFFLALSESVPIIGAVVTSTSVTLALSALVPSGVLLLWTLLVAAKLGAVGEMVFRSG